MDIRKVKKLIEMLESSNLEEIEIQEGEESVRLVKTRSVQSVNRESVVLENNSKTNIPEPKEEEQEEVKGSEIKSPMVGTFYSAPSPGASSFIKAGDIISEGDVVCIVEAMKMMNEIKSEFSGTVLKVHVENAEPVEFGQALFTVE
jgi:acetyl-CoA carboxylase biotin carboxyl carrier protein